MGIFFKKNNDKLVTYLYELIVNAARDGNLFINYNITDNLNYRFEVLLLYTSLIILQLERFKKQGNLIAEDISSDLVKKIFKSFDDTLREQNIGDLAIPKRVNKLAAIFYGRLVAYNEALEPLNINKLAIIMKKNILNKNNSNQQNNLIEYIININNNLEKLSFEHWLKGEVTLTF